MGNILSGTNDYEEEDHNVSNNGCYGMTIDGIQFSQRDTVREVLMLLTRNNKNVKEFIKDNEDKFNCQVYCCDNLTYNEQAFDDINQQVLCYGKMCLRIKLENITIINFVVEVKQHGIHHNQKTYFVGLKNNSKFHVKEETQNIPDNKLNYDLCNINNMCTFIHPFINNTNDYSGTIIVDFYTNLNHISDVYNDGYRLREVLCGITEGYNCAMLKSMLGDLNSSLCKYLQFYEFPIYQSQYNTNIMYDRFQQQSYA